MGFDYSYEVIGRRGSADSLIRSLAKHLTPQSRAQVLSAQAGGAERIMDDFERQTVLEQRVFDWGAKDMCLSFSFEEDEALVQYAAREQLQSPPVLQGGRVDVGCVWTSIDCGDEFVRVDATAATDWISTVFSGSPNVRQAFSEIGSEGGGLVVLFDGEGVAPNRVVWPFSGEFSSLYYQHRFSGQGKFYDHIGAYQTDADDEDVSDPMNVDQHCLKLIEDVESAFGPLPL